LKVWNVKLGWAISGIIFISSPSLRGELKTYPWGAIAIRGFMMSMHANSKDRNT
jgi:hypothetical protein